MYPHSKQRKDREPCMTKSSTLFFFTLCNLLLTVGNARADHLYETNLLKQDATFKPNPIWSSNKMIEDAQSAIKNEPERKAQFLFDIASVEAHQGKLKKALTDLDSIADPYIKNSPEFLEEKAEIESLQGSNDLALKTMDKLLRPNWKSLWHRSIILERAGKSTDAKLSLQKAIALLQHEKSQTAFATTLQLVAQKKQIGTIEPDPKARDAAIAGIQALMDSPAAPETKKTIEILGLSGKIWSPGSPSSENIYIPATSRSPYSYVTITPDGNQIRLFLDIATCSLSPEMVKAKFGANQDAGTPASTGRRRRTGPITMSSSKKNEFSISQFVFDSAESPALDSFFISYRKQRADK